jgi:hypothetical protein
MILKSDQSVKNILNNSKTYQDDDAGFYAITTKDRFNTMIRKERLRVKFGDAGQKIKGEGSIDKRLGQYVNALALKSDLVEIGRWVNPIGIKRDYELQSDLDKIATRIFDNGKAKELWDFLIPEQLKMNYLKSFDKSEIIQFVKKQIDEQLSKKNKSNVRNEVKLRKLQKIIIRKIMKILEKKGIESTLVAELAPRIGKTLLFLSLFHMMNRVYGHKVMMIFGYGVGLSIFKSYADEINSYRDLKADMVYIDSRDKKASKIFKDTIKKDKMAVVMVSLNTKEKDLPKFLENYKDSVFALLEEGDFGCHTHRQIPKVEKLLKGKKTFRINASGTNIGKLAKAFGTSTITDVLAVPYSTVEEDTSTVDRVKRKYYNMSFDDSINKHLKDWDPDHLPSIGKIFRKPLAQKLWIEEVFKSIYDYEPQWGLSIDHQAGEQIFGSMIFGNFEKKPMEQLQRILTKALPEHYIEILNGDTTNTRKAQDLVVKRIGEIKRGDHKGKRKLIVITNMIGSRSFTVPEIQACLMFQDNGEVGVWTQKTSRCLSPEKGSKFDQGIGKNFGHIFDFNMDPNKVRNTEMALIYDAKARSDLTGKTFVESLREVMNSASLKDVFKGKWLNDQDLLKRIEDTNKLLDVADNSTNFDIDDLSTLEINLFLSIRGAMASQKRAKLKKLLTGRTFSGVNGKRKGASNDSSLLSAVRLAIKRINSSSTTVSDFVKGTGDSYSDCIDIIANDPALDEQFLEMYGITANNLKQLLPRLPLGILDICIYNSKHGFSQKHITNKDIGILGDKDDPELWNKIISQAVLDARIKYALKNDGKILIVAGGLGTEVDILVEKYGKKIIKHIWFNDKFKCFTNRVKRKYNTINVIEGDFLSLNIDMKFDVILGNPPYQAQNTVSDDRVQPKNHNLWTKFVEKSFSLLEDNGVIGFITPDSWMSPTNDVFKLFKEYQLTQSNDCSKYFSEGSSFTSWIAENRKNYKKSKIENLNIELKNVPYIPRDLLNSFSIHDKVVFKNKLPTIKNVFDTSCHSSKDFIKKDKSAQYKFELFHTNAQTRYSDRKSKWQDNIKVVWTLSGYYKPNIDLGIKGFTEVNNAIIVKNKKEADCILSMMNSKLYHFLANTARWSGFLNGKIFNLFPQMEIKVWNDKDIYNFFSLTPEEIDVIERYYNSHKK